MTDSADRLNHLDKLALNLVQDGFPIHPKPYDVLAARLKERTGYELSGLEFLNIVNSLKKRGFLRRLGGIFNSAPLGYRSTLCAARVPDEILDEVVATINARAEVTHNYIRANKINVWFTFCHDSVETLNSFLDQLRSIKGIGEVFDLPAKKVYKIRAVFNLPLQNFGPKPEPKK
ncbi:MAG: Lrp/AsnC family transcriptional regulator [Deltaproteobacteria bacterium]|nr:Lrp/AsnC family transcriptional regulator [Deltaproteobacteria bacterium]